MSELEFEYSEGGKFVELKDGMYEAVLDRVEIFETQYGKSLRWIFKVETEDGEEVEVNGVSSAKFSNKSKAFKWFTALGGKVKNGKVYLDDVIGNECLVQIENRVGKDGETKFPNVVDVKPPMRRKVKEEEYVIDDSVIKKKKKKEEEVEEEEEEEEEEVEEEEEEEEEEEKEKKRKSKKKSKKSKK